MKNAKLLTSARTERATLLVQPAFDTLHKVEQGCVTAQDIVNLGMVGQCIHIASSRKMINSKCADELISYARRLAAAIAGQEFEYDDAEMRSLRAKLAAARSELRFVKPENMQALATELKLQAEISLAMRQAGEAKGGTLQGAA